MNVVILSIWITYVLGSGKRFETDVLEVSTDNVIKDLLPLEGGFPWDANVASRRSTSPAECQLHPSVSRGLKNAEAVNQAPASSCHLLFKELLAKGRYLDFTDSVEKEIGRIQARRIPTITVKKNQGYDSNVQMFLGNLAKFVIDEGIPSDVKQKVLKSYINYHKLRYSEWQVAAGSLAKQLADELGCKFGEEDLRNPICVTFRDVIVGLLVDGEAVKRPTDVDLHPQIAEIKNSLQYKKMHIAEMVIEKCKTDSAIGGKKSSKNNLAPSTAIKDASDGIQFTEQDRINFIRGLIGGQQFDCLRLYLGNIGDNHSLYLPTTATDVEAYDEIILRSAMRLIEYLTMKKRINEFWPIFSQYKKQICRNLLKPKNTIGFLAFCQLHLLRDREATMEIMDMFFYECADLRKADLQSEVLQLLATNPILSKLKDFFAFDFQDHIFRYELRIIKDSLADLSAVTLESFKHSLKEMNIFKLEKPTYQTLNLYELLLSNIRKKELALDLIPFVIKTAPAFDKEKLKGLPLFLHMFKLALKKHDTGIGRSAVLNKAEWVLPTLCERVGCDDVIIRLIKNLRIEHFAARDDDKKAMAIRELKDTLDQLNIYLMNIAKPDKSKDAGQGRQMKGATQSPIPQTEVGPVGACPYDPDDEPGFGDNKRLTSIIKLPVREALRLTREPSALRSLHPSIYPWYSRDFVEEATKDERRLEKQELSDLLIISILRRSFWAICRIMEVAPATFQDTEGFKYYIWTLLTSLDFKPDPFTLPSLQGLKMGKLVEDKGLAAKLLFLACENDRCPQTSIYLADDKMGTITSSPKEMLQARAMLQTVDKQLLPKAITFPQKLCLFMVDQFKATPLTSIEKAELVSPIVAGITSLMNTDEVIIEPYINHIINYQAPISVV